MDDETPYYPRFAPQPVPVIGNFFKCECSDCNWTGSSQLLDGGVQFANGEDYSDVLCPVCGSDNIQDVEDFP